jgi:hypothetical protein
MEDGGVKWKERWMEESGDDCYICWEWVGNS